MKWLILLTPALLFGCASMLPATPWITKDASRPECQGLYQQLDQATERSAAWDAGVHRLPGFPFLRSNRHLASFHSESGKQQEGRDWIAALAKLDLSTRRRELANLLPLDRQGLASGWEQQLSQCSSLFVQQLQQQTEAWKDVADAVLVKDNYQTWKRVIGIYPVAALLSQPAISDLHERLQQPFRIAPDKLPIQGELDRYLPSADPWSLLQIGQSMEESFPAYPSSYAGGTLSALFHRYAPIVEVDRINGADRVGRIKWIDNQNAGVDQESPVAYLYPGQTRFQGKTLLQLNYLFWFPARDTRDIYGGTFDALVWRVTLDKAGTPMVYDSIHGCGCYYQLFPAPGYRTLPSAPGSEIVLSPARAPALAEDERLVLRLAAGTHYLLSIHGDGGQQALEQRYQWADYWELLSLPLPGGGRHSLFGADGLIAASARLERFFLWPFGIPSPGAMRQFGTHAIAFIGRRHFDDPGLLDQLITADQPEYSKPPKPTP